VGSHHQVSVKHLDANLGELDCASTNATGSEPGVVVINYSVRIE
jgi:hypothetical protein